MREFEISLSMLPALAVSSMETGVREVGSKATLAERIGESLDLNFMAIG
jgi:hypothetical protein